MEQDDPKHVKTRVISQDSANEENNIEKPEHDLSSINQEPAPEFNPHDHGNEHHPTFFWGSVIHLLKAVVGRGVLAIPYNFKSVGYGVAIPGTLFIGYLYVHVLHLLLDVEYYLCRKLTTPNLTYLGVVKHSFEQGPRMFRKFGFAFEFLVYVHYVFNKCLSNSVNLITIGENFKIVVDHYYGVDLKLVTIMSVVIIPLIILGCIRKLKFLVPLSMLSNLFNVAGLALILVIPTQYDGSSDLKPITDISEFPRFFSILISALGATGMILPLKNDMKTPKRFSSFFGVLNVAFFISTMAYCVFGLLGYLKYGEQLHMNVLQNLPAGSFISQLVILLYSLALFVSFTILIYISFDTIWSNVFIGKKLKYPLLAEYSIRITLCIVPYIIAVTLPDFKIMLTVVGVIGIVMDKAIPPILHILMLMKIREKNTRIRLIFLKDIGLLSIFLILFVAALWNVIQSIIAFYTE